MDGWQSGTQPVETVPDLCHIRSMKKTKLDMSATVAGYIAEIAAEEKRRRAIRERAAESQEWFAKWEATRSEGQWGRWHISDRD